VTAAGSGVFFRVFHPLVAHLLRFTRLWELYRENTQNRAEKPGCIFISVGGRDILNPAMPV